MSDQENTFPPDISPRSTASATAVPPPRLGQLMLLIAAVAIGIVGIRNCDSQLRTSQIDRRHPEIWIVLAVPMLMSLTSAAMAVALLQRRTGSPELCRRPGFAACWVTMLVMMINAVNLVAMNPDSLTGFDKFIRCMSFGLCWLTRGEIGLGVLIAWTTLVLTGCCGPEPSWIDRSGRVLGVVWIIAFVADRFAWLLWL